MKNIVLDYTESKSLFLNNKNTCVILLDAKNNKREKIGTLEYKDGEKYKAIERAIKELEKMNVNINLISFMDYEYFYSITKDGKTI